MTAGPSCRSRTVFTTLAERLFDAERPLLPTDLFTRHDALVWRRHPALPFVQALPLTQRKEPPNEPSASRQLAPFTLPTRTPDGLQVAGPAGWRLGVTVAPDGPAGGARTWARLLGPDPLDPAAEWRVLPDLPMAALSLPGLQLSASGTDDGLGTSLLKVQYRYDLPYTDEVQALAQPPKSGRAPDDESLRPDAPPEPGPPLGRETYAAHWRRLSEKAGLAAADATAAFGSKDDQVVVRNLVEPLTWKVDPTVGLDAYPGRVTIADAGTGTTLVLEGGTPAADGAGRAAAGTSDAAVRGISGLFAPDGDTHITLVSEPVDGAFVVEAGSMAAHRNPDGTFRDQRGLSRDRTREHDRLLTTTVRLDGSPHRDGAPDVVALVSSRAPWDLEVEPDHLWRLWFRDLPTRAGSFERAEGTSPAAEDVNDPEALGRAYNHLNGYEWRLADSDPPADDTPALRLCGLEFFPLSLERLDVADGVVERVDVVGRLQLPLGRRPTELTELGNVVRATFTVDGAGLALTGLEPAAGAGEWPLALSRGELGGAARIIWTGVRYEQATHTVELTGAELRFALFEVEWRVPLKPGTARFAADVNPVVPEAALPAADGAITTLAVTLTLD
ncbi:MAG: hypothetical protein LC789_09460, partial [Actinobacteria bacterium]|nr:hypothetical protein [Actinomycetota bacterium]